MGRELVWGPANAKITMAHLSGKDKIILSSTLWLVVGAGMALGVILPLYLRLQNFPERHQDQLYRLEGLETAVEKFSSTKSDFEHISGNIQRIRMRLLDPEDAVLFIEALEDLARKTQLYKEIQLAGEPQPAGQGDGGSSFIFQLTLVGTFEHVMEFAANLENFSYAVDIEKISMVPIKDGQVYGATAGSGTQTPFKSSPGDVATSMRIRVHASP